MEDGLEEILAAIRRGTEEAKKLEWDDLEPHLVGAATDGITADDGWRRELTLDEVENMVWSLPTVVYYVASEDVPVSTLPAPGEPDEPALFLFRLQDRAIILCHPDHVEKLRVQSRQNAKIVLRPLETRKEYRRELAPFAIPTRG